MHRAKAAHDPEFGATVQWDVPVLAGHPWVEIPNKGAGSEGFWDLYDPGLWSRRAARHGCAGLHSGHEFEEADFDGSLINRIAMLASGAHPGDGHYELADLHLRVYGNFAHVRGIGVRNE